jgi:hypothetical protein
MLGFWLARGAMGALSSQRRGPAQQAAPAVPDKHGWAGAVIFALLLPLIVAGVAAGYHGHASFAVTSEFIIAFWALLALFAVVGKAADHVSDRAVLRKYAATPEPEVPEADRWRALAAQMPLEEAPLDDRARELLTARLFLVTCPEPACRAPATVACVMGIAVPVSLVDRAKILFCHHARMRAALEAGVITRNELAAQSGGTLPEGV